VGRIDLQLAAYGKERNIPQALFTVLEKQKQALLVFKEAYGAVVTPNQLADRNASAV